MRIWAPVYEYEIKVTHTAYESVYVVHVYLPNHASVYVFCTVSVPSYVYVFCIWDSVFIHTYVFCLCLCFCASSSKYVDGSSVLISVMCSVFVSVRNSIYSACVFLFIGTLEHSVHVIVTYLHRFSVYLFLCPLEYFVYLSWTRTSLCVKI